jgi:hypothetical protein
MGELIYNTNIHQDWISLFFLFNLTLFVMLNYINHERFVDILRIFSSSLYIGKYANDRNYNYLERFNFVSFLFIANTTGLFLLSINNYVFNPIENRIELYYYLTVFFSMITIRFFIHQFILRHLKLINIINIFLFKSFINNTRTAFFLLILLFIDHYTKDSHLLVFLVPLIAVLGMWLFNKLKIIFSFIKTQPGNLFYLIFYLCNIKIAPWMWLYLLFLETRL